MYAFVDQPVDRLCNGGRFLLWAMRGWTQSAAAKACPPVALARGFAGVNALGALTDFNSAMTLLNRDAREELLLGPMRCKMICDDEALLIGLWRDAAMGAIANLQATLTLIVKDAAVAPIAQAMAAAATQIGAAGFDLADLARSSVPKPLKEEK